MLTPIRAAISLGDKPPATSRAVSFGEMAERFGEICYRQASNGEIVLADSLGNCSLGGTVPNAGIDDPPLL